MKKIFTNGVFDLFHEGHYSLLERAKSHGDWLLVGVCSDESCEKYKRRPFQSWEARAKTVRELPFVDEVIQTPWTRDMSETFYWDNEVSLQIQGDDGNSSFKLAEQLGILRIVGRTENISTSKILQILNAENAHILEGGYLNDVVQVHFENELYVIKYSNRSSAKKYNIVLPDNRSETEYNTTKAFHRYIDNSHFVVKPICIDRDQKIIIFKSAPSNYATLFSKFTSNEIDFSLIEEISKSLALMHLATYNNPILEKQFGNSTGFLKIKIDIQCRSVTNDDILQKQIDDFIDNSLDIKLALLHGDFAPKNILVWNEQYLFIDFEESSYADPALDLGYFIAHLYIHYFITNNIQFKKAVEITLKNYLENIHFSDEDFIIRIWKYAGIFILSRIDGKAHADYLKDENIKNKLRHFGKLLFLDQNSVNEKLSFDSRLPSYKLLSLSEG